MKLQVNGEPYETRKAVTLADLLVELGLKERRIAVAVNGEVAPKSSLNRRRLDEGDVVEVIHAVAGG